jgi:hypothetical protein
MDLTVCSQPLTFAGTALTKIKDAGRTNHPGWICFRIAYLRCPAPASKEWMKYPFDYDVVRH